MRLGSLADGTFPYKGKLDEVKVFRSAMSPTEIQQLYDSADGSQGLVAHWAADEGSGTTAADRSGFGNNAAVSGAAWATGLTGPALSFDGVNDYASVSNFGVTPGSAFTLSAWIKAPEARTVAREILAKGPENAGHFSLYIDTDGILKFYAPEIGRLSSGYVVDDDEWHHVAVMVDSGVSARFYLDGVLVSVFAASGVIAGESETLRLGSAVSGSMPFKGLLSDVRIYNRKLSWQEIAVLATP